MSRVNFGAKPNMYPLPVLIIATYDKDGNPDAMNAAWGVVTDFNEISISMGDHKTTDNLAAVSYTHLDVYKRQVPQAEQEETLLQSVALNRAIK